MVAFHYPPFEGGSGIHRALKFSRYFPELGWRPLVLSANPRAYPQVSHERLHEIPDGVLVKRAFALDTARQLAFYGRYPKWLAFPDRWVSWWLGAVPAGLRLIRKHKPQLIWSTYPVATAHLIALTLHRLSGIPWVADFRDSMTEDDYPTDPTVRNIYRWIERHTVNHCERAVFTTPGALRMYESRYPAIPQSRWQVISNGYDDEDFILAEKLVAAKKASCGPITLLHSGVLYPSERDPLAFFSALAELRQTQQISPAMVKIVLRGCGHEEFYTREIKNNQIEDIVKLEPPIPYHRALAETLTADGLLIFQASNCNHQIPAKVYEYLRAKRPILALTDSAGDTASLLEKVGLNDIVSLDSREEIAQGVLDFLTKLRHGTAPIASDAQIALLSRKAKTVELVNLLSSLN